MDTQQAHDVLIPTADTAYRDALEKQRPKLMAMPEAEILRRITLDPTQAAAVGESAAKKAERFRPELTAQCGAQAGQVIDELLEVSRAVRQADVEVRGGAPSNDLSVESEELRKAHRCLLTDADALANRGLIDPKRLEPARDTQGYQAIIRSVLVLVYVLREYWSQIEDRTPLTEADLERAEAHAQRLASDLSDRDNGVSGAPVLELRTRALSKLIHLQEELQRMVTYVRWYQHDADLIAPSLWANRGRKGRSPSDVDPSEPDGPALDPAVVDDGDPATPATPSPNNGGGPFTD